MGGKDVAVNLDNIKLDVASVSDVTANVNSTSNVAANVTSTSDIGVDSKSDITVDTGNIKTELVLPQPLKTQSHFAITEPIEMKNSSDIGLDIRPMVMDFCFKFEFGELPSTCIRRPYQHHFGITLFGVEVLGFNFAGESRIMIEDVQKRPHVAWGGEPPAHTNPDHPPRPREEAQSLRIRLG